MSFDTAICLAAIALALLWPIHQQLTIRALRRALQQLHRRQAQHGRAIIQLQTTVAETPLQVHQPMPRVGRQPVAKVTATTSGDVSLQAHSTYNGQRCASADDTLRLQRPPSLARIDERCKAAGLTTVPRDTLARIAAIEQHLAGGRTATRMELATVLGAQPWEVTEDLRAAVLAKIVTTTTSHTAGEATYTLADPTVRMGSMPVLWGAR